MHVISVNICRNEINFISRLCSFKVECLKLCIPPAKANYLLKLIASFLCFQKAIKVYKSNLPNRDDEKNCVELCAK